MIMNDIKKNAPYVLIVITIFGLIYQIFFNTVVAKDRAHLKQIIALEIERNGNNVDLNHIDVSKVTDMGRMFYKSQFNGDISNWTKKPNSYKRK